MPSSAVPLDVVSDKFFTSPNYPNNYPVLIKKTYQLTCSRENQSLGLFILGLDLNDGDSLIVHNERYDGPTVITIPVPKLYSVKSIDVTLISDVRRTARGFRIVHGCYSE